MHRAVGEPVEPTHLTGSAKSHQLDVFAFARLESARYTGRDIEPHTKRGRAVKIECSVDFEEVVVAADLNGAIAGVGDVDEIQEAMALSRELREGSQRAGAALLSVHRRLNTAGAEAFSAMIAAGHTPGHLGVVQGLVWRASGLTLEHCQLLSAHTFCVGVLGAALRLGVIGHVAGQTILGATHPFIITALQQPAPPLENANGYSPLAEIATMRHQDQTSRLFSN